MLSSQDPAGAPSRLPLLHVQAAAYPRCTTSLLLHDRQLAWTPKNRTALGTAGPQRVAAPLQSSNPTPDCLLEPNCKPLNPCRCDRWPTEGGRPTATTDGLFEVSHARLVRLLALLCPAQLTAALQQPLASRLAAYTTPSGPQEKAEVASVAEALAGLLAAAAPVAAGSGVDASWAVALLKEALVSTTLEMSDAWSAGLWYILDHLLSPVMVQTGSSSGDAAAGCADTMDVEALDVSGGPAASPAAVMLQQVLAAVMAAVPGRAAAGGGSGNGAAAVATAVQGSGALPSDLKRLKYLVHCLPPIRKHGTLGTAYLDSLLAAPAAREAADGADASAAVAAATAAAQTNSVPGLSKSAGSNGRAQRQRLPKSCRVFLAALMQEVSSMLEVEQPTTIRECLGSVLGDLAGLFAAPVPLLLPAGAADGAAADDTATGERGSNGGSSGCSSPVEIEVPVHRSSSAAAAAAGDESSIAPEVLLLNSSIAGLRSQAAVLLQQTVRRFAVHAAQLESLKNSGSSMSASSSSANLAAGGSSTAEEQQHRPSDNSDDVVMVEAPDAAAAAAPSSTGGVAASLPGQQPRTGPDSLAQSLTHCGVGLQMLIAAVESGESASLRPLLAALLPGVLQLQELSGPGLQQLTSEAKSAFVLYKYLPFSGVHVKGVTGAILGAGSSEAWSSRAAAMVFLQVFWFRHCYLLGSDDMEQLQVGGQGLDDKSSA